VRKVPKNQVPAALHDNQDAVTVSQDGDVVTVTQTGTLVSGYEGDDAIGTVDTHKVIALDVNIGSEDGYAFSSDSTTSDSAIPNEAVASVYGLGDGHMVVALFADMMESVGNTTTLNVSDSEHSKTLTINFVPNE
jgi:hypothetical protein